MKFKSLIKVVAIASFYWVSATSSFALDRPMPHFWSTKKEVPILETINKERWMTEIFSHNPYVKLRDVVIPGTHDSGSYGITRKSKAAPGKKKVLLTLMKPLAVRWAVTQEKDIYTQLKDGIRELDLRIAFYKNEFYLEHGLLSVKLEEALKQIAKFTKENPKEIIFVEYFKLPKDRKSFVALQKLTLKYLYPHLIRPRYPAVDLTFHELWNNPGKSLILTANDKEFKSLHPYFWDWKKMMSGVYANTTKVEDLENSILNGREGYPGLMNQEENKFHYASFTFTGSGKSIFKSLFRKRKSKKKDKTLKMLSIPLRDKIQTWMRSWKRKGVKMNIVTADFYHLTGLVDESLRINLNLVQ